MALALGDGASRWAGPEWARCLVDLWEETKKQSGLKIFYYIRRHVSYFGCVVSFIHLHVLMIWISTVDAVSQIITLSQRS